MIKIREESLNINLKPTKKDVLIIKEWLAEEVKLFTNGFYYNLQTIEDSFKNNKLITLEYDKTPIGYATWRKCDFFAVLDIFDIKPIFRKKGFGKLFFNMVSNYFTEKRLLAIELYCISEESEKFWKKMKFIKFPNIELSVTKLQYFKPLIKIKKASINKITNDKIELWDVEPHASKRYEPKWTWHVNIKNNKLEIPIIHPCNSNWNLRWTRNGKIIIDDKVKYFGNKKFNIEYCSFLYIHELID